MTDHTERWLPVPGYEGYYDAWNRGQVRSIRHMTAAGWRGGTLLSPFLDGDGYYRVNLSRLGVVKSVPVHVIILLTFGGPPKPGQQGRHGPGGKLDNRWPENLCWGTPLENSDDKYRDGTMACGERQGNAKLTAADVREIRRRRACGETQEEVALRFGISPTHVGRVFRCENWAHVLLQPLAFPVNQLADQLAGHLDLRFAAEITYPAGL